MSAADALDCLEDLEVDGQDAQARVQDYGDMVCSCRDFAPGFGAERHRGV